MAGGLVLGRKNWELLELLDPGRYWERAKGETGESNCLRYANM